MRHRFMVSDQLYLPGLWYKLSLALTLSIVLSSCGSGGSGARANPDAAEPVELGFAVPDQNTGSTNNSTDTSGATDSSGVQANPDSEESVEPGLAVPDQDTGSTSNPVDTSGEQMSVTDESQPASPDPDTPVGQTEPTTPATGLPTPLFSATNGYGPFNDQAVAAAALYSGETDDAEFTGHSTSAYTYSLVHRPFAGRVLGSITGTTWREVFDIPYLPIPGSNLNPAPNTTINCANDIGSYSSVLSDKLVDGINYEVTTLEFVNCKHPTGNLTVNGAVSIALSPVDNGENSYLVAYDNYTINAAAADTLTVNGAMRRSGQSTCGVDNALKGYLLLTNDQSGEQLLLHNMRMGMIGTPSSWCDQPFQSGNWFEGGMLLSGHGLVWVYTPAHLSHINFDGVTRRVEEPALHETDNATAVGGQLVLTNAVADTATFSYGDINLRPVNGVYYEKYIEPTVSLILYDRIETLLGWYEQTNSMHRNGSFANLQDVDNDGISDGWEQLSGFDSNDQLDATLDLDNDGLTTYEEFRLISDPTDIWSKGRFIDQELVIDVKERFDDSGLNKILAITITGTSSSAIYEQPASLVRVEFTGDGAWLSGCYPTEEANVRLCSVALQNNVNTTTTSGGSYYGYGNQTTTTSYINSVYYSFEPQVLELAIDDTSPVAINASFERFSSTPDPVAENDTGAFDYEPELLAPDLSIEGNAAAFGNEDYKTLSALILQQHYSNPTTLTAMIAAPPGVELGSAQIVKTGEQDMPPGSSCVTMASATTTCHIPYVETNDTFELQVLYKVSQTGIHDVEWEVTSGTVEDVLVDNVLTTQVEYIQSTDALQSLIDTAQSGDAVALPSGRYLGQLDGKGLTLSVSGSVTGDPTVLVSDSPLLPVLTNPGNNSMYENIEFRTAGTAVRMGQNDSFLTIANSLFAPAAGVKHALNSLVDGNNNYRLINNRISGWGQGNNNTCSIVTDFQGSDTVWLQHNVIHDNDCDAITGGNYTAQLVTGNHFVIRNTFVNNSVLHRDNGSYVNTVTRYENNVITGTTEFIDYVPGAFADFVSSGNLLSDNGENTMLSPNPSSGQPMATIEHPEVLSDPQFVDPLSGNYDLTASSPAIDTAGPESTIPGWPVYSGWASAVDGNLDGAVGFDIGAHEFQP